MVRQNFGSAVEGQSPKSGNLTKATLMGKPVAEDALGISIEQFGKAVEKGRVDPVSVAAQTAFKVTTITPGGGLEAKNNATYDETYKYDPEKTAGMFGAAKQA